jgi:tryptophan-rich sensory protein
MRRAFPGLVFFAITFAVAAVGAMFTPGPWYETLAKPAWTPPGWIFAPVWTALYVMIAVAGWLVWVARGRVDAALAFWGAQLALNGAWSWLFFGLENPGLAAVDIVLLLTAIVVTIRAFARVSVPAATLLVPYALWVGFATALNIAIWRMNA